jgi:hypothetical protein
MRLSLVIKRERRFGKQVNKLNNFLVLNKSIKAVLTLLILGVFHKLKLKKKVRSRQKYILADVVLTIKSASMTKRLSLCRSCKGQLQFLEKK